jgi:Lrp/AsnC family transcriptional regulator for asnA, asnC and gidA
MDKIDSDIIASLQASGNRTMFSIADELGVATSTISRRLKKLQENGIVSVRIVVDPKSLGYSVLAVLCFNVKHDSVSSICEEMAKIDEIKWLVVTTGRYDIMAWTYFRSVDDIVTFQEDLSRSIPGILSSETFVCIRTEKLEHVGLKNSRK